MDVLLVLDVSSSMAGGKIYKLKSDTLELIEELLKNDRNNVGLIIFNDTSTILSDFTNDKELLMKLVEKIDCEGNTNYYEALKNTDKLLKKYIKEEDKDCVILFLTDGYPNISTPNEEVQYEYLKKQYQYLNVIGLQYEMGNYILNL